MASEKMKSILLQLRGAELKVPNMRPLYKDWASGLSPHYEDMVSFTNEIYEKLLSNPDELKKAKACDFGYTSAGWFPTSGLDRLKFMATYCAWFFTWDDATDREEVSLETGNRYRAEALEYIQHQLGLSENGHFTEHANGHLNENTNGHTNWETNGNTAKPTPETLSPQLELFASIGKSIREGSDDDLIKFFSQELQYIIDCCGKEQENKISGELPTTEEYWDMRYGTSGVTAYCAVAPYMIDVKIPSELFQSSEMKAVWLEMNVNVIIFNDIISLKKEVADDAIVSLIPVIMAEDNIGLAGATNIVYEKLATNCRAFDQAVAALHQRAKGFDELTQSNTEKLITCYEAFLSGVMNWSYTNARYKVAQDIQKDGSLLVTL